MSDKYLVVGGHADTLNSGRPIAPGDTVPASAVDLKSDHDKQLLAEGRLIEPAQAKKES